MVKPNLLITAILLAAILTSCSASFFDNLLKAYKIIRRPHSIFKRSVVEDYPMEVDLHDGFEERRETDIDFMDMIETILIDDEISKEYESREDDDDDDAVFDNGYAPAAEYHEDDDEDEAEEDEDEDYGEDEVDDDGDDEVIVVAKKPKKSGSKYLDSNGKANPKRKGRKIQKKRRRIPRPFFGKTPRGLRLNPYYFYSRLPKYYKPFYRHRPYYHY